MRKNLLEDRINHLIGLGNSFYDNLLHDEPTSYGHVTSSDFIGFRTLALSFISNVYGNEHRYHIEFKRATVTNWSYNLDDALAILNSVKYEIDNGWLDSLRDIVSAELFSDFMEMSKHLLEEGYKDAAAVMLGSILEEQLRLYCKKYDIDVTSEKGGKIFPKKASSLNDELYKEKAYNLLNQKNVSAWLEIRNNAAHGHYHNYSKENVELFYWGLLNFLNLPFD